MVPNVPVLVTISSRGYVKRLPPDTYRLQKRGGQGIRGQVLREEDALRHMLAVNAHDSLLFFTDRGRVFQLEAHRVPEADRTAKGLPIINLIGMDPRETITAALGVADFSQADFLLMATRRGEIKKVPLEEFASVRSSGLIAMDLEAGDELAWVKHCKAGSEIILVTEKGQAIRFEGADVPVRSRMAGGVRGIRLAEGDRVVGMDVVRKDGQLLVVTSNGFAKRTPLKEYPLQGRGGSGVKTATLTEKTGTITAAHVINGDEELMVISAKGIVLRTMASTISGQGRAAQGVGLIALKAGDRVACVATINGNGAAASQNGKA
jgi:DNA gyrase subunit A